MSMMSMKMVKLPSVLLLVAAVALCAAAMEPGAQPPLPHPYPQQPPLPHQYPHQYPRQYPQQLAQQQRQPPSFLVDVGAHNGEEVRASLSELVAAFEGSSPAGWPELIAALARLLEGPEAEAVRAAIEEVLQGLVDVSTPPPMQAPPMGTMPGGVATFGDGVVTMWSMEGFEATKDVDSESTEVSPSTVGGGRNTDLVGPSMPSGPIMTDSRDPIMTDSRDPIMTESQPIFTTTEVPPDDDSGNSCHAVGGWGPLQCTHVCAAVQLTCNEKETRSLHNDLSLCIGAALDVYGVVTKAAKRPANSIGAGCVYRSSSVTLLEGDFGCGNSPPSISIPHMSRLCCCDRPQTFAQGGTAEVVATADFDQ